MLHRYETLRRNPPSENYYCNPNSSQDTRSFTESEIFLMKAYFIVKRVGLVRVGHTSLKDGPCRNKPGDVGEDRGFRTSGGLSQ